MLKLKNIIYQIGILGKDLYNVRSKLRWSEVKRETYRLVREVLLIIILAFFAS